MGIIIIGSEYRFNGLADPNPQCLYSDEQMYTTSAPRGIGHHRMPCDQLALMVCPSEQRQEQV